MEEYELSSDTDCLLFMRPDVYDYCKKEASVSDRDETTDNVTLPTSSDWASLFSAEERDALNITQQHQDSSETRKLRRFVSPAKAEATTTPCQSGTRRV